MQEQQYLKLLHDAAHGTWKENRTGQRHIGYFGDMLRWDLREGFPLLTTKEMDYQLPIAEMIGFIRGYESAADFRKLQTKIWDADANKNKDWLANPNRQGEDHLGPIYGAQWRGWHNPVGKPIDQLKSAVEAIQQRKDNRRLVVSAWNPAELDMMALPPCHVLHQWHVDGAYLDLSLYQRSCDVPLGIPFNTVGYATLLMLIAQVTGLIPRHFIHFMGDIHIYEDQLPLVEEQLSRKPSDMPKLHINPDIKSLEDLETWATVADFILTGYESHPVIRYPFSTS